MKNSKTWGELQKEAQEIVRNKFLWKRFIDGTPLANDIACWMASFAQENTQPAQKPLTNEQIDAIVDWPDFVKASMMSGIHLTDNIIAVVRAVEAAHGIKGE